MRKKRIYWITLGIVVLLALTGCKEDKEQLKIEKVQSESKFLENECMIIFNKYMENEYLNENQQINWQQIEEDYTILNHATDVIIMDMASLPIASNQIAELEKYFYDLNDTFHFQKIEEFMKTICDIYKLVSTTILENVSSNQLEKQEKEAKSKLVYIGYYLNFLEKENTLKSIEEFQDSYSKLSKNKEYLDNYAYKMNRIYVDIQKIQSLIERENWNGGKEAFLKLMKFF